MSSLFSAERLPRTLYCSNNKTAARILSLGEALQYAYIQFNPAAMMYWMVFDIDRPDAFLFGKDNCDWRIAPTPNMIVLNPENGHAHYWYGLLTPVCMTDQGREGPKRYALAIWDALSAALGDDPSYARFIAKNPLHPTHRLITWREEPYELGELAESVDLEAGKAWRRKRQRIGLDGTDEAGRNCTLFRLLSRWAYSGVLKYREVGNFADWESVCSRQADLMNLFPGHNSGNLSCTEVRGIARSVAQWTWKKYKGARGNDPDFLRFQAARGRLNGARKRRESRLEVLRLAKTGMGQREIAQRIGVSQKTISNWLQRD